MLRITTFSGAVYTLDVENKRVLRHGPHSNGIDYSAVPDDEWHTLIEWDKPTVGESWSMILEGGSPHGRRISDALTKYRITTPVDRIEEVA